MFDSTKLATTSWSLSIELVSYALLAIYFAASSKRLIGLTLIGAVMLAVSSGYCVSTGSDIYGPYCIQNRYGVIQAGFIPFAAGGLIYLRKNFCAGFVDRFRPHIVGGLLASEVAAYFIEPWRLSPFIGSIGMAIVIAASSITKSRGADFIGRASYHLFIAHMSIAAILATGNIVPWNGPITFVTVLCLLLSYGLVAMERSIEVRRQKIGRWAREAQPALVGAAS